jgi:2-polyprenyl-3-methyl-5-hydroxy-6-metoxy-1,4-benzoquinol methylase
MKEMWDKRYAEEGYAYGTEPNKFLEQQLAKIPAEGKALFAAEGEGRNAVHAAKLGWKVTAFDLSESGKTKALLLAEQENVSLNYFVENLQNLDFKPNEFDLLVLIYAHFPAELKSEFHKKLANYVKPGGHVVFEAFSKEHIKYNSVNPKAGGPKDVAMLFSVEEVSNDFRDFEIIQLQEKVVDLNEGKYHIGQSSVVQFVGRKLNY